MYTKKGILFRELWQVLSRHRYIFLLSLLAVPVLDFLALAGIRYSILSLMDCLLTVFSPPFFYFTLLPLSALWVTLLSMGSENPMHLIRRKSRRTVYLERIVHTCLVCLFFVVYSMGWTLFLGSFFSISFINWDDGMSFYYVTNFELNRDMGFWQALLTTGLCAFLGLLTIHAMALLAEGLCRSRIAGFILMIVSAGWNIAGFLVPLVTGWLSVDYRAWTMSWRFTVGYILCPIVILLCWTAGGVLFEKRDFIRARD